MIAMRRTWSTLVVSALSLAIAAPINASPNGYQGGEVQDKFLQGVELLERGRNEEALAVFQEVLAMDPSNEAAYELWQNTNHDVWLKLLTLEGDYELVAKRFMGLTALGRKERVNDSDAISALLKELNTDDILARTRVIRQLASDHGEYAVPQMLYALADPSDDDRRVIFMQALTQMGGDVVLPLQEALDSPDAFLRRNAALTLGYIGDDRAAGVLAWLAAADEDDGVRVAAGQALTRLGVGSEAHSAFLAAGEGYYAENPDYLLPHQVSGVTWRWEGTGIEPTEVPAYLYKFEMSKKAYYRALAAEPGSIEALAGIARASVAQHVLIAEWRAAGQDVGDWPERLAGDDLAVRMAGQDAVDLALGWSLDQEDLGAATGLCRTLKEIGMSPSPNLERALTANASGAIRGEAAVALGHIAFRSNSAASRETVIALAEAASREVVQIAGLIDNNDIRRQEVANVLDSQGMLVNSWPSGARGLGALRSIPGVDVLLIGARLTDLTLDQVLADLKTDPRYENTPVLVMTADVDRVTELYGDKIAGTISSVDELDAAVTEAVAGSLNGDREQASSLAAQAAGTLSTLADSGQTDVSVAADALASTLSGKPDEVALPAMSALAHVGNAAHVAGLAAVVTSADRSEAARVVAARALGGVFDRVPQIEEGVLQGLHDTMVAADDAYPVRQALATAMGRLDLSEEVRLGLMKAVRSK